MNYKIPSLLYVVRLVLFVSILSSLLWMSSLTSAVLYLIAISFNLCDFVISNKYTKVKYGTANSIIFLIIDRVIVLMPFFFACLYYAFAVWVFVIMLAFDVSINLFRYISAESLKNRKIRNVAFYIYNISVYAAAVMFLVQRVFLATYFVFAATIVGAVCIIILSICSVENEESFQKEGVVKDQSVIDETSLSDEIFE